jgi:hypothetical protein
VVRDNVFYVSDPSAVLTGGIYADPSAVAVSPSNNRYVSWPAGIPQETNTATSLLAAGSNSVWIGNGRGNAVHVEDAGGTAANNFTMQPATTGFGPLLGVEGTDANVPLNLAAKGASPVQVLSNLAVPSGTLTVAGVFNTSINYQAPTSGATITMTVATGMYLILNPAGTLATLTIALPTSPVNGQLAMISTTQQITALTLTTGGPFMFGNIGSMAAGTSVAFRYSTAGGFWIREDKPA